MTVFILLAIVLTVAAVGAIAVPLLRRRQGLPEPATWAAVVVTGLLLIGAAWLYVSLTNYSWHAEVAPAAADSPQSMVARLARRLERNPDDAAGWLMLGRSYAVLNQLPLAIRAYERADKLSNGQNVEALVGLAETLALSDEAELNGRAGELFEKALKLDPKSGKALFYGAAAALRRGDLPLARDRFAQLLALDPPANIKPILEQQIAAIDRQVGGVATSANAAGVQAKSDATATASIRINIVIAPALAQISTAGAPLFVAVRDPQNPGPPLAVKRLTSRFPQLVELTPADSMMAGRGFAVGQPVEVVARVAKSGSPVGATGDLVGRASYRVGRDGLVDVVIDQLTP